MGPIDRWSFMRLRVIYLWDRLTDGPLWGKVWFTCGADRPMVLYEVTCFTCGVDQSMVLCGFICSLFEWPIDRWSFMGSHGFCGPIDRWSCFICKSSQPYSMGRRIIHCRWSDWTYSTLLFLKFTTHNK